MRNGTKSVVANVFCAMACVAMSATAQAESYKIKLSRAVKVGDTMPVQFKMTSTQDAAGMSSTIKVALDGDMKVDAVSSGREASKYEITVGNCTQDDHELIRKGAVITVAATGGAPDISIDGTPATQAQLAAFAGLLSARSGGDARGDDATFGTDHDVKPGDTWDLDTTKVAKELQAADFPATADQIKGTGKLVEVKKIDGTDAMLVQMDIDAKVGQKALDNGMTLTDGTLSSVTTVGLPLDVNKPGISEKADFKIRMNINATTPDGKAMAVKVSIDRTTEKHFGAAAD